MPNAVDSRYVICEHAQSHAFTADTTPTAHTSNALYRYIDWGGLPVGQVRIGLSGVFDIGAQAVTFRVRIGGIAPNAAPITTEGTVVLEFTLAPGAGQKVSQLSAWVAKPTGTFRRSFVVITAHTASGTSSVGISDAHISILTEARGQALMLSHGSSGVGLTTWSVDFDLFDKVDQLVFSLGGQRDRNGFGNHRIKLGGGWNVDDGTVLLDYPGNGLDSPVAGGVGVIAGEPVTIAKSSLVGTQLVKLATTVGNYYSTVIIREPV